MTRVLGFLAILGVAFGLAWGVGNALEPVVDEPVESHDEDGHDESGGAHEVSPPGGLMVSQDGLTFDLETTTASAGRRTVEFRITGPDGEPVTAYDVEHEKRLHLIAVRRDFAGFQHVHPELAADGTWSVPLELSPGQWRLFADFKATGAEAVTLGADLSVPGRLSDAGHLPDTRTADVDGYTVTLDGDLAGGQESRLTLQVTNDGRSVDVEPYLGASGHLVALREGDLAYLHVHPESTEDLVFIAAVPSNGRYHLYLDFKHDGVVRTAHFSLAAGGDHGDH